MPFYSSVKDEVRDSHTDGDEPDAPEEDDMGFDALKQGAEDAENEEHEKQDDTEIEVLADGELVSGSQPDRDAQGSAAGGQPRQDTDAAAAQQPRQDPSRQDPAPGQPDAAASTAGGARSGQGDARIAQDDVVETLERMADQQEAMLDVLRGIKRSLDGQER